jgi:hypothetical protein
MCYVLLSIHMQFTVDIHIRYSNMMLLSAVIGMLSIGVNGFSFNNVVKSRGSLSHASLKMLTVQQEVVTLSTPTVRSGVMWHCSNTVNLYLSLQRQVQSFTSDKRSPFTYLLSPLKMTTSKLRVLCKRQS